MEYGTSFLWILLLFSICCYLEPTHNPASHRSRSLRLYQILQLPHHDDCNTFLCSELHKNIWKRLSEVVWSVPCPGQNHLYLCHQCKVPQPLQTHLPRALLDIPQQKDFRFSSGPFMLQFKLTMVFGHQRWGEQYLLFATDKHIISWLLCSCIFFFRFLGPITS